MGTPAATATVPLAATATVPLAATATVPLEATATVPLAATATVPLEATATVPLAATATVPLVATATPTAAATVGASAAATLATTAPATVVATMLATVAPTAAARQHRSYGYTYCCNNCGDNYETYCNLKCAVSNDGAKVAVLRWRLLRLLFGTLSVTVANTAAATALLWLKWRQSRRYGGGYGVGSNVGSFLKHKRRRRKEVGKNLKQPSFLWTIFKLSNIIFLCPFSQSSFSFLVG
jgi:hypothetical protein